MRATYEQYIPRLVPHAAVAALAAAAAAAGDKEVAAAAAAGAAAGAAALVAAAAAAAAAAVVVAAAAAAGADTAAAEPTASAACLLLLLMPGAVPKRPAPGPAAPRQGHAAGACRTTSALPGAAWTAQAAAAWPVARRRHKGRPGEE